MTPILRAEAAVIASTLTAAAAANRVTLARRALPPREAGVPLAHWLRYAAWMTARGIGPDTGHHLNRREL